MKDQIIALLAEPGVGCIDVDDLPTLLGLRPTDPADPWSVVDDLVKEGLVGRSYRMGEDPPGCEIFGRIYFVWLRSPETAEFDRQMLRTDKWWAAMTGGLFGHDRDLP